MQFEYLDVLEDLDDVNTLMELLIELNHLRRQGLLINSYEELPPKLQEIKSLLGIKESQAKALIHELLEALKQHSRLSTDEYVEFYQQFPENIRKVVTKAFNRLYKSKF